MMLFLPVMRVILLAMRAVQVHSPSPGPRSCPSCPLQTGQCSVHAVFAGDPGRGHKGVVAVVFALLWCFGGVLSQSESSGRTGGQLRRGGIRKGTRLEFVVEEGAMRGKPFGGRRAESG